MSGSALKRAKIDTGVLTIRPSEGCELDGVSLGETMLRLDPTPVPTPRAKTLGVYQGGGENNVIYGLSACFGMNCSVVTALVDDGVGRNIELQLREGGLSTKDIVWFNTKGEGKFSTDAKGTLHNGINFTYSGKGVLPAVTEYYRAHTPIRELECGDINWKDLFERRGVRWFHTGGIYTLLSDKAASLAQEALIEAGKAGTIRSFDLNYRSKVEPDKEKARSTNKMIMFEVDVVLGNQDDFDDALGFKTAEISQGASFDDWLVAYTKTLHAVSKAYPKLKYIGTQLRGAHSADVISWSAILYEVETSKIYKAHSRERVEILDRVGGGDSFVSGLAAAFLQGRGAQTAVEWGAAHGILVQETPGDTTMVLQAQVEAEVKRASSGAGVKALR